MVVDRRATVVAQRAVDLAAHAGRLLPDDLELWGLAGGRPPSSAAPEPGTPDDLGRLLETSGDPAERRRGGVHHTPPSIADGLAERALADRHGVTVGDPACGGGALLLAAGRAMVAAGEEPGAVVRRLHGCDLDPLAVATTQAALSLWAGATPPPRQLVVADALRVVPWGPVDVLVGNPPFLSPLASGTGRTPAETADLRARFGDAVRAYTDSAGLFLLAALDLVVPGGRVAMLQPQSILGGRDAQGVRTAAAERAVLEDVWEPDSRAFSDAAVEVCALVLAVGDPAPPAVPASSEPLWSVYLAAARGVPAVELAEDRRVGDEASVVAAFRQEYYGMVPHVVEAADVPDGRPVITTGLIELGRVAWGERPARIGGRRWTAPVIEVSRLDERAARWAERTAMPKVLVASQTRVVEVAVDDVGHWLPSVPVVAVLAPPERLWLLAAALASPPVTAWLAARSAGTGRSAGSLKAGAPLLRTVPLPSDEEAWTEGAAALRSGDLLAFAATMTSAYGAEEDVCTWWLGRAGHRAQG
ncbi:MAG: N-6 DNA methylase [Acidimicrobiales bacterium]